MSVQLPRIKRGLFGYRAQSVRDILISRDVMISKAQQRLREREAELARSLGELELMRDDLQRQTERARAANAATVELRARIDEAETELASLRGRLEERSREAESGRVRIAELEAEIETLRAEVERLEPQAPAEEEAAEGRAIAGPDLSKVLEDAEGAFARMIEGARMHHRNQLEEIRRAREELRAEMERYVAWRKEVQELARTVRATVNDARAQIADTPERLRAALDPTSEAIIRTNDDLEALVRATEQLPLTDPSEEEPVEERWVPEQPPPSNGSAPAPDAHWGALYQ